MSYNQDKWWNNSSIITDQLSFLKSIRIAIGTSKSISTKTRTTQLTSVSTGGFAWNIKLEFGTKKYFGTNFK